MSLVCRLSPFGATVLFALACAFGQPESIHAQTTELDQFVGKDLWKHRLPNNEQSRLNRVIGIKDHPKGVIYASDPVPWHVWKTNHNSATRYIVLLGVQIVSVPGGTSACVLLFDAALKPINNFCFQTGWRIAFDSASFEFSSNLGSDLIVLHMARVINGANVAKEYFAIGSDTLRFVRMENDLAHAVQNNYVNDEIGIVPAGNTEDEWIGMLESADKASTLSALVFLGGRHITERHFALEPTESKYAVLFQKLVGSQRIRDLITDLSRSDNEWVKQAAVLAASGLPERLLQ